MTWVVGKVKVGEKVILEVWAKVGPDCSGTLSNTAEITSSSLPYPTDLFSLFDAPPPNNDKDEASFNVETGSRR